METLKLALLSAVLVASTSVFAQNVEPAKKSAVQTSTNRADLAKGCEDLVKKSQKKTVVRKSTSTQVVKKPASTRVIDPKKATK